MRVSAVMSSLRTHAQKPLTLMPDRRASAIFGPTPETLMQTAEQAPLLLGGEAIQHVRVLAHHQVREQAHLLADGGQMEEGRHRRFELIADPADIDGQLRRGFGGDPATERANHR